MSATAKVCIICNEGATSKRSLTSNPDMIEHLYQCCRERLALGQTDIKEVTDRLASSGGSEHKAACYHSECRKPIVNKNKIERLRSSKRLLPVDSHECHPRGPGRPSSPGNPPRPNRVVTICTKHSDKRQLSLDMAGINETYITILKRYMVEINDSKNYRKYLKQLLQKRLPNVKLVPSVRKNEAEKIVLSGTVSKSIELHSAYHDDGEKIAHLKNVASMLRKEIMQHRNWSFNGSFEDSENPHLLQFFMSNLLFGRCVMNVSGKRNEEIDKVIDVTCQVLVQNARSDRQVKHQPKEDSEFMQTVDTSLSIGLPLAIHSRVRDKNLVTNLSDVYIGSNYRSILDIERRVEQGVLTRMRETGGFCWPAFVKRGVNVWFAVDNKDLLEDTPTGQNTFHGTVIVLNQRAEDGDPVHQPLVIPTKIPSKANGFEVSYQQQPIIKPKPIRFASNTLGKREQLVSSDYTRTWALANYVAIDNTGKSLHKSAQVLDLEMQSSKEEEGEGGIAEEERAKDKDKEEGKTSPTDYATLYTALMMTQGISAVVVGPERRTIITLDLDLYSRALQIQQSVGNSNWVLRAGVLHIVFAALHALGKTIDGSGLDTCAIESGTHTSAALRGIFSGKAYKRGLEYHITTSLAILMMKYEASVSGNNTEDLSQKCALFRKAIHERNPDMVDIYDNIQPWQACCCPKNKAWCGSKPSDVEQRSLRKANKLGKVFLELDDKGKKGWPRSICIYCRPQVDLELGNKRMSFPKASTLPKRHEHYQLLGNVAVRSRSNALKLRSSIEVHCEGNPYDVKTPLKSLVSSALVPEIAKEDILLFAEKGQRRYAQFVEERLLPESKLSVWDPMKKLKLKTFASCMEKTKVRVGVKVVKLRKERELLGRFLIIQGSRTELVPKLEETIGEYEMSVVPRSFCAVDGSLYIPTDKASLIHSIENARTVPLTPAATSPVSPAAAPSTTPGAAPSTTPGAESSSTPGAASSSTPGAALSRTPGAAPSSTPGAASSTTPGAAPSSTPGAAMSSIPGATSSSTPGAASSSTPGAAPSSTPGAASSITRRADPSVSPEASSSGAFSKRRLLLIDAMAVIQGMKKSPTMLRIADLRRAFILRVERMLDGYQEARVVFDRYIEQSLKNKTRQKRATTSFEFEVYPVMRLTMSLKELLSSSKTKSKLTVLFAQGLLDHFATNEETKLVVMILTGAVDRGIASKTLIAIASVATIYVDACSRIYAQAAVITFVYI
ncbi:predicted protein [Nematostella vectensis]|uniref:Uncharacterized protein n=1 Tax=Nematostella vectensis TaxID=45351 RepID=A7S960_NEMVE|nr:predicted protein [Nematostella vectensis]|eukprot:XP_001631861.1 predicted protein [Nematostella vectensis]